MKPTLLTDPAPIPVTEPNEAEIQKQAYHLWVEGGCLEGVELDNWLAAALVCPYPRRQTGERSADGHDRPFDRRPRRSRQEAR